MEEKYCMPMFRVSQKFIQNFYSLTNNEDIKNYIKEYIYDLLDLAVTDRNRNALNILMNQSFLTQLKELTGDAAIDFETELHVNHKKKFYRIVYDYVRLIDHNIFIQDIMLDIVFDLDRNKAFVLMGFNLSKEQACMLVAARYSYCIIPRDSYKRLIRMIQMLPSSVMTEQNIVDIMGKIANESVTDLFIAMMNDPLDTFANSEEEYVYSTVNLAVLDIVESLPQSGIYKVLSTYIKTDSPRGRRFQLKSINISDYPRINGAIDSLEYQGNKII